MSEKIELGLTKEEWARCVAIERSGEDPLTYEILASATKAMCWINGNRTDSDPEKFTREDVENLRNDVLANAISDGGTAEFISWLESLIARLESLLPPEK